ncbi:hypothetical protein ACFRJ9_11300 [Paenarthrobacter sp. NPDC056912]|uniref:hypothetical protein n=1 Tax=Paenarthrobacter sp. NPDC056912 TaxID=3345965 RepID=UPI003672A72A
MSTANLNGDNWVMLGLSQLRDDAFGPSGFALGESELIDVLVHRTTSTFWRGRMYREGQRVPRGRDFQFSDESLAEWLGECRARAYRRGLGTWTTAEVHVYDDRPGRLDLFDEERLERASDGEWFPGGKPSDATAWSQQLLAYPRTVDNIPAWMWDIFRAEGVTPPIYNPEFKSVDWNNRRRPVTDRGTDFTVEPTIIDPSKEPGFWTNISRKLFGSS